MMTREQLARKCIERLEADGHQLFGCHCGRIHIDAMGIVNPQGWEPKELRRIYLSSVLAAVAIASVIAWFVL